MSHRQLVDNMERVWRALESLCAGFDEAQWKTATECPGWSVQDQLSHIVGSESGILGRPAPDHTPADVSHTKNDLGRRNEVVVDWRRPWRGAKVLDEFREVTAERMTYLKAMTAEDFEAKTQTPVGPGSMRMYIAIRIFDAWVHEQDIRRALDLPGGLDGPVAEHAMSRIVLAMPYVVGKKAAAPEGASVVFEVTGPTTLTLPIGVERGRARPLDAAPDSPTVRLRTDFETFACLACGRWDPEDVLASGGVAIEGDRALGETVVRQMNFMI